MLLYLLLFLGLVALLLLAALCRRSALNALESIETREMDTLRNARWAIRVLFGDDEKATFIPSKDRSSSMMPGASRRKGKLAVAKMLTERKKREEKIKRVRADLAAKLTFRKTN